MGDFVSRIQPLVASGTVFEPHIKTNITNTVSELQLARVHLAGASYGTSILSRVDAVIAKFTDFQTHVSDQVDNFLYNITVFQSVYADTNEYDVNSYFGSLLGKAADIAVGAAPDVASLKIATGSVETPLAALEALATTATTLRTNEQAALAAGLKTLEDQADAIQFNSLINSPLGANLLRKMGGTQMQAILDDRQAEVNEELGFETWEPGDPVSDDPSQWFPPSKADPTP